MPPRVFVALPLRHIRPRWHRRWDVSCSPSTSFCPVARPSGQSRLISILARLSDNPGAYKPEKRRGRGPSSGLGKTSGRGHKGQKQHGKVPAGFEGGQTPQHIVQGKRGFTNPFSEDITPLPLTRIQSWIAQGRIDPTRPITPLQLLSSRCIHRVSDGIKLLASSQYHDSSIDKQPPLSQPLNIVVSRASAQAIAAVEAAGGTVTTRYYTKTTLQNILKGRMDPAVSLRTHPDEARKLGAMVEEDGTTRAATEIAAHSLQASAALLTSQAPTPKAHIRTRFPRRLPDPAGRKDLEYYRDAARRGYLAHEVPEGDSPSLYFKTRLQRERESRETQAARKLRRATVGTSGRPTQRTRNIRPGERIRLW